MEEVKVHTRTYTSIYTHFNTYCSVFCFPAQLLFIGGSFIFNALIIHKCLGYFRKHFVKKNGFYLIAYKNVIFLIVLV